MRNDTEQRAQREADWLWELFMEIWHERPHLSEVSGDPLMSPIPKTWMFDHLLEMRKYPELKMVKANIILCTFAEHELRRLGNATPKHRALIDNAKKLLLSDKQNLHTDKIDYNSDNTRDVK